MLHVGVGIVLRTRGSVDRLHIVGKELQLGQRFTVLTMGLTVEHERLGHLVVAFAHQCFLHLILNVLHLDVVVHVEVAQNLRNGAQVSWDVYTFERFDNRVHNLV